MVDMDMTIYDLKVGTYGLPMEFDDATIGEHIMIRVYIAGIETGLLCYVSGNDRWYSASTIAQKISEPFATVRGACARHINDYVDEMLGVE